MIQKNTFQLCVPVTPTAPEALQDQLKTIKTPYPDLLEWRRDYLLTTDATAENRMAEMLKDFGLPVIYTFRGISDGGVSEAEDAFRCDRILGAMAFDCTAYVDVEWHCPSDLLKTIGAEKKKKARKWILSAHNFEGCFDDRTMKVMIDRMMAFDPDVIKIAQRPSDPEEAKAATAIIRARTGSFNLPVIHVLMGPYGIGSRVFPEAWGGSMTYGAGPVPTAPGQLSPGRIRQLREKTEKGLDCFSDLC